MSDIVLINANMTFPSDANISGRSVPVRDIEKVVNLGMLSVASYLDAQDISVKLLDLVGHPNEFEEIRQTLEQEHPQFVGISCISCFTYPNLKQYARLVKAIDRNIFLIAGGQQMSSIPQIAMEEIPELDCVVRGEGEYISHHIIYRVQEGQSLADVPSIVYRDQGTICDNTDMAGDKVDLDALPFLKYTLYPEFHTYQPHVEVSRWCAFNCYFCTSRSMSKTIKYKSMARFVDELEYVTSLYGQHGIPASKLQFFFACSTFGLKRSRVEEFIRIMQDKKLNIRWRTETRVDAAVIEYLKELHDVGMGVIDLGLESGSPTMLKVMNKCRQPWDYLLKASKFIMIASDIPGLLVKVNLVFYAGESPETLRESVSYLMLHAEHIDTMSAGPVVMYANAPLAQKFPEYEAQYGTSLVKGDFWDQVHAYPINPSESLCFEQLNIQALLLAKMLCPEQEYFEVKKYGQYPITMDLEEFRTMLGRQGKHSLPFYTT